MNEVFNYDKLMSRRLSVKTVFAMHRSEQAKGEELIYAKEKMARQLAKTILDSQDFFKMKTDRDFAEIWANCVVLTEDELADYARQKFKDGINHASGFMSMGRE